MNYPTTQSSLLERVQQGDEISWNEFYFRYTPVVRAASAGFKFNETKCDDLVQLVMLKFFHHAETFVYRQEEVDFRTYFSWIVQSQSIDMIRHNDRQKKNYRLKSSMPTILFRTSLWLSCERRLSKTPKQNCAKG